MKPQKLKEIIDTLSGLLTGIISTFILYALDKTNSLLEYREMVPATVGAGALIIGLLLILKNKKSIDLKEKNKTNEYKTEIKEKIKTYSQIIKDEKEDSEYRKQAQENLALLLRKDMALIEEMEVERASLKCDSQDSDGIMFSYIDKLKEATKQTK